MRTNVAMSDDTVQEGTKQHVVSAVAKYKFDAENPMELSVSKGDEVSVIETNKKMGWWLCRNSQLLTGYVPASYLTETHEKLEEINIDTHGAVPMSLTTILDNKVAQGLISPEERQHIIKVCITAADAHDVDEDYIDVSNANEGSSKDDTKPMTKTNMNKENVSGPSRAKRKQDERIIEGALRSVTKFGCPGHVFMARLEDLEGFGFDRVQAAQALQKHRGDITQAMATLLDENL
eukprot:m.30350 g.30350  ORF g.30350 m.30350 type:complete len:235 (+) comp8196_c0_seq4:341-1045(+)